MVFGMHFTRSICSQQLCSHEIPPGYLSRAPERDLKDERDLRDLRDERDRKMFLLSLMSFSSLRSLSSLCPFQATLRDIQEDKVAENILSA